MQFENNNLIVLIGKIVSEFELSHEIFDEKFYTFYIDVLRLSEASDVLSVTIPECLLDNTFGKDDYVNMKGQIRSYNNYNEESKKNKLMLNVFTKDITLATVQDMQENTNEVQLAGFLCKKPVYRTTPFGREICDLLIAVNRAYNKSDYIPCITWGRNAKFASRLEVGSPISVYGRMQSRVYTKKYETGEIEEKTAYEVSITKIDLIEN